MGQPKLGRILVVDDEVVLMQALCEGLSNQQYEVVGATSGKEALQALGKKPFDVMLSDLMMPELDGIEVLKQALEIDPQLVGIIMTGHGTVQTAVEAMKIGAFDYVLKPFKLGQLLPIIVRAVEVRRLKVENVRLKQFVGLVNYDAPKYKMIGTGPGMLKVFGLIERVAPTEATVLIRGASGTGKELVARALHHNSNRRDKPMVMINCATLQETLLESELFGHEKGSFTGAQATKRGLIEVAEGGTLFIDEVAEMSPGLQAKLLRVLEDGHFRRVGSTQDSYANVRVIAATNKPLEEEQKAGRFREDLFYRLNVITIALPLLRERKEDIPALVDHFLSTRAQSSVRCQIDADALQALQKYHWPGNVRELANVLERAQILSEDNHITIDDLPDNLLTTAPAPIPLRPGELLPLHEVERRHVQDVMRHTSGNKVQAAKILGISRRALYRLIEKYHLSETRNDPGTPAAAP